MEIRFNFSVELKNEEEKDMIYSKTKEYIYSNDILKYSGFSNGYNYVGFCSYSKDNNWVIYGDLVEADKFELELDKFRYYLNYIGIESKGIKLIVKDEFKIKSILNLVNVYSNYEPVIKKSFRINNRYFLKEEEVDNLNELVDMTEELPEDIIELAIEGKEEHRNNSPIDLSKYPSVVFRDLDLEFESMKNYFQFIIELVKKCHKRVFIKKNRNDYMRNEKYQMRSLLRNLGFNGEKFKNLRRVFLKNLSGNIAFRNT